VALLDRQQPQAGTAITAAAKPAAQPSAANAAVAPTFSGQP
jgi:hypothetical protein